MSKKISEEQLHAAMSEFQETVMSDLANYVCFFTDEINCQIAIGGELILTIAVPQIVGDCEVKTATERSKMH